MGWSYGFHQNKQSLIDELINNKAHSRDWTVTTIKHHITQEKGYHVLWTLDKVTFLKDTELYGDAYKAGQVVTLIGCYLLDFDGRYWGYSSSAEYCEPFYYSCPLTFLRLAEAGINQGWRDKVKLFHDQTRRVA